MDAERMIHITNFSALFNRSSGIPVSLYDAQGNCEVCYPLAPERLPLAMCRPQKLTETPDVMLSPSQGAYGMFHLEGGWYFILGPVYNVPVTEALVGVFMQENYIAPSEKEPAVALLSAAPRASVMQFWDQLVFFYYGVTGKVFDPSSWFGEDGFAKGALKPDGTLQLIEMQDNQQFRSTFQWEQQLYRLIQAGDSEELDSFLLATNPARLSLGVVADKPLRQAKNTFIAALVKVGSMAAIPGGLDAEETYRLQDSYIVALERLATPTDVDRLLYTAMLDFCRRMEAVRIPQGISPEIFECMRYIRKHTSEPQSLEDVARHIGRGTSYTTGKFKRETGMTVGEYITQCRLESACKLLAYSKKSLADISAYLCFSSQSYFQNVFKKKYGVTPMQYRKQRHS